jgi:hypothetical protein
MKKLLICVAANPCKLPLAVLLLLRVVIAIGLWLGVDRKEFMTVTPAEANENAQKIEKPQAGERLEGNGSGTDETEVSDSHPSSRSSAGTGRLPLQVLDNGKQTMEERVRRLQGMRGISLSKEERESALSFLSGKEVPEGMGKSSQLWLADELLTVLQVQVPPWDGLAAELGKVAFQPGTDPVVRDYIMQHLGHLWEQSGPREEIEEALWQAVESSDETTPGTALLALSRGYERDGQEDGLAKVRQQALTLAEDPNTTLAVRVTALSIAGDGGGTEVKRLAGELAANPESPVILRKVAERVLR